MKKILIFCGIIVAAMTAIITPSVFVMQGFIKSLEKYEPEETTKDDEEKTKEIHDSNQGFLDLNTLNLNLELGDVNEITTDFLVNKIKILNPKIKDLNIYIKGLTLRKLKFTVENYRGAATASFTLKSLSSLIENTQLGNLKNIQDKTIFEKIKEKNPKIPKEMNFEGELSVKVISLNEIIIDWITASNSRESYVTLNYAPMSLSGLLPEVQLGETSDISIDFISKKLLELNSVNGRDASFLSNKDLYKFEFSKSNNQSVYNASISLKTKENLTTFEDYKFSEIEGDNVIFVTYEVTDISILITNTNLGEIENFDSETILKKVLELNPLYKSYRGSELLSNSKIQVSSIRNARIDNISLGGGPINLSFKVTDISKLISNTNLGDFENYSANSTSKFIDVIFEKNSILKDLNIKKEDLVIGDRTLPNFEKNTELITGAKFNLSIKNTDFIAPTNSISMNFNIKRKNLETELKNAIGKTTLDIGRFSWKKPIEIIDKIKRYLTFSEGKTINLEEETTWGQPTYEYLDIIAKPSSLLYYGYARVQFETIFEKTNNFDINFLENSNWSNNTNNWIVSNQTKEKSPKNSKDLSLSDSAFEIKYEVPLGLQFAQNNKSEFIVNFSTNLLQASAYDRAQNLGKYKREGLELKTSLKDISKQSAQNYKSFYTSDIEVPSRKNSKPTSNACSKIINQSIKVLTEYKYSAYLIQENQTDFIVFQIRLVSKLAELNECDNFNISWEMTVSSINIK